MSIIRGVLNIFSQIALRIVAFEVQATAERLRKLEKGLSEDLARLLDVPVEAISITALPVPKIEVKCQLTPAQLAYVERFLDSLSGPKVNVRFNTQVN
jgi:hypothetical protein